MDAIDGITMPAPLGGPVLGLESSCDETAAAVLAPDGTILAEAVLSQEKEHAAFGGVVPEIAARAHLAAHAGVGRDGAARGPGLVSAISARWRRPRGRG